MNSTAFAATTLLLAGITCAPPATNPPNPSGPHGSGERRELDSQGMEGRRLHVGKAIKDCEDRTNDFKAGLKRFLAASRIANTDMEAEINSRARSLEHEMDIVREEWTRDRDIQRVKRHVARAIQAAQELNVTMNRHRMTEELQDIWRYVRKDIYKMADAFDLPALGLQNAPPRRELNR